MGLEMKITDGTNVLVDLTGLVDADAGGGYVQVPGSEGEEWTEETIPLMVTTSTLDTTFQALGRAFSQAKRYEEQRLGPAIYLEARKSSSADWKRSRLKGDGVGSYDLDAAIRTTAAKTTLSIVRENWWEKSALVNVPISNPNGSVTSLLQVYDSNDGGGSVPTQRWCYGAIAAANTEGDMPAPAIITTTGTGCQRAYLGIGAVYNLTWNPVREAESNNTPVADAACSGGNYANVNYFWQSLLGTDLGAGGSYFWPLLRGKFPTDLQINVIGSSGSQTLSYYPVTKGTGVWDLLPLEPMRLPPYPSENNVSSPEFRFYQYGSPIAMALDFVAFLPVDYWMEITSPGIGSTPSGFVADCAKNEAYMVNSVVPASIGGTGIYIQPGKDQRLFYFWASDSGHAITAPGRLTVQYRPRWRML